MEYNNYKENINKIYGLDDLGNQPAFQGGYINFGYWENIDIEKILITKEERIQSSIALYDLVFNLLNIQEEDVILEVGCGRGYGCSQLKNKFNPKKVIGIDITPQQIERARKYQPASSGLGFEISSADSTPFPDDHFTKIYAVESAQHIPSLPKFAQEAWRLLKHKGLLIIAAHFSTNSNGYAINRDNLPLIDQGIDFLIPSEAVEESFTKQGFQLLDVKKIGNEVFGGMDKWSRQVIDVPWAGNFLKMYKEGNLEYYIFVLRKE